MRRIPARSNNRKRVAVKLRLDVTGLILETFPVQVMCDYMCVSLTLFLKRGRYLWDSNQMKRVFILWRFAHHSYLFWGCCRRQKSQILKGFFGRDHEFSLNPRSLRSGGPVLRIFLPGLHTVMNSSDSGNQNTNLHRNETQKPIMRPYLTAGTLSVQERHSENILHQTREMPWPTWPWFIFLLFINNILLIKDQHVLPFIPL